MTLISVKSMFVCHVHKTMTPLTLISLVFSGVKFNLPIKTMANW